MVYSHFHTDELLLTRQVKSYQFLFESEVSVESLDDTEMFKSTIVSDIKQALIK